MYQTQLIRSLANSAIFRITGTCYFWQFSFFDGNENSTVYTDANDFSTNNKSKPIFSHHKLTCFEYADGVNKVSGSYVLTDLDMFYAKLSNAYGTGSGSPNRNIDSKYPAEPDGFAKMRPRVGNCPEHLHQIQLKSLQSYPVTVEHQTIKLQ